MAVIRVPYPQDPDERRALFGRLSAHLLRFGQFEGTPERGTFAGATPIGRVAGSYLADDGEPWLSIELREKPWLVPASLIESELRRLLAHV